MTDLTDTLAITIEHLIKVLSFHVHRCPTLAGKIYRQAEFLRLMLYELHQDIAAYEILMLEAPLQKTTSTQSPQGMPSLMSQWNRLLEEIDRHRPKVTKDQVLQFHHQPPQHTHFNYHNHQNTYFPQHNQPNMPPTYHGTHNVNPNHGKPRASASSSYQDQYMVFANSKEQ